MLARIVRAAELDHEDAERAEQQRVRGRNSRFSRWVASWRLMVSTSRFSQCARRSRWPLNSLIVLMPRSVSRKWLSRRAAQTIASDEAWRSGM